MRSLCAIGVAVVVLSAPVAASAQVAWDSPSSEGFVEVPRTGANIEAGFWGGDSGPARFAFVGLLRAGLVLDRAFEIGVDAGFSYGILSGEAGDHGASANPRISLRGIVGERRWRLRVGGGIAIPAIPSSDEARATALLGSQLRGYQELWLWGADRLSVVADAELVAVPVDFLYLEARVAAAALISASRNRFAPGQAESFWDPTIDLSAAIGVRHDNLLAAVRFRQTFLPTFDDQAQSSVELFLRPTTHIDDSSVELFGEVRASMNLDDPLGVTSATPMWGVFLSFGIATTPREIPDGRFGVSAVRFDGVERVDERSIAACLGTRSRSRISIDAGLRGTPECGAPPFDGSDLSVELFAYPWSTWPLFDENVFERDVERIERWYRARGYYDARVLSAEVQPEAASLVDQSADGCGDGEGNCEAEVTFSIEEGEPVRIARIAIRGLDDLPEGMRAQLRATLTQHRDDPFDEALYEETKRRMLSVLADASYGQARVTGDVKINTGRREAFIVFQIHGGLPNVIGRVCVAGHGELDPELMLAVTYLEAGTSFSLEDLQQAQRAIYGLGVFSAVEVGPVHPRSGGEEGAGETSVPADDDETTIPQDAFCSEPLAEVPEGARAVDVLVQVTAGRRYRIGVGGGFQAGQAVTVGTTTGFSGQENAAQWDLHLSFLAEDRNLGGSLILARFEVRPRAIFDMPFLNFSPAEPTPFGILVSGSLRAPGVFEPRTNLVVDTRVDLGPMPFSDFFRLQPEGQIGLNHTWLEGRVYAAALAHGEAFIPTDQQPLDPRDQLPLTYANYLEAIGRIDMRDDPRNPHSGGYLEARVQGSVQPLSTWTFARWLIDARGYVPLGAQVTIAARFQIGGMHVLSYDTEQLAVDNRYQLHQLGPPSMQLRGGGASSNRGFLPGLLGDAQDIYYTEARDEEQVRRGEPVRQRSIRNSGGTALWQASLEIRVRLTVDIGVVVFADAGDVLRPENPSDEAFVGFRFDRPQFSFGLGLRYRTIIGPLRIDVALRPDALQDLGSVRSLPPDCRPDRAQNCRPRNTLFGVTELPGAIHLTIGESF